MDASENINEFKNKIPLWKRRFKSTNLAKCPTHEHELSTNNIPLFSFILTEICVHLDVLKYLFVDYSDSMYSKVDVWL